MYKTDPVALTHRIKLISEKKPINPITAEIPGMSASYF
jgi:hypothetical protein